MAISVDPLIVMTDVAAFADCRNCLCQASRSAARGVTSVFDRHLRPHGLRITQFTILANLILRGATPVTALAEALGADRTTLTRNLTLLMHNGWIETHVDENDARTHLVSATAKGRAVAQDALPAWRKAQNAVAAALGGADVAALRRLANATLT
ncbi:MAG: MarR family winged helix-turn-helix transcriptional regulator [Roseiarcus sp.]